MPKRKIIPPKIEREILFRNQSVCCICQKSNVQIHHIDGNNSNNKLSNLAVLCIEHHDSASTVSTMTRRLSSSLVRQYKFNWEAQIARKRKYAGVQIKKKKIEDQFIKFELRRLIYSLPAFPDKKSTNSTIEQLYNWHLLTGNTRYIIKLLGEIHWFLKDRQIGIILDRLYEFFWQFVGPEYIKIQKTDENEMIMAIELLGDLGEQLILVEEHPRFFKDFFTAISNFEDCASLYKNKRLKRALKRQLMNIKEELLEEKKYPQRKTILTKLLNKLKYY